MSNWTFITNHGIVFLMISRAGRITTRQIAAEVGITERSVLRIIKDLEEAGYIERKKEGRKNIYQYNPDKYLRHDMTRHTEIGALLRALRIGQE